MSAVQSVFKYVASVLRLLAFLKRQPPLVKRSLHQWTHNMSDLLIIENQAGLSLQDLLNNNQIIIG